MFVWDLNQLFNKIGVFIKKKYTKAQIQTLFESNDTFLITKMLDNRYFLFTYYRNKIKTGKENFLEPEWTIYDFSHNKIIAVEAQIHSQDFGMPSQLYIVYNYYFFCLQRVYEFSLTPIPTPSKRWIKIDLLFYFLCIKKSKII